MNLTEIFVSFLPLALALALALYVVSKTGAFDQRRHRKSVEALLERIAIAVEAQKKS